MKPPIIFRVSLNDLFSSILFLKESKAFSATVPNDGELIGLNVDEAKRQMVQIDQVDKLTYKEKQKMWRKVVISSFFLFLRFSRLLHISFVLLFFLFYLSDENFYA